MKTQRIGINGFARIMAPKEWGKLGGIAAACLLVIILLFLVVAGPQTKRLNALKAEEAALKKKSQSYRYFDEFASKMEQQRIKVESVIGNSHMNLTLNEKSDQNFLDDIGRICKDAFIKLENINPVENGRAWSITFTDTFQKTINFMTLIEKDFKIENFALRSGEMQRNHRVDMTISPLRIPAAEAPAAYDFMDLFEQTNALIGKIEEGQAAKKTYPVLTADPMFFGDTIIRTARAAVSTEQKDSAEQPPELSIDGIYYDPATPVAVVEGRAMREGDTIRGIRIEKINEKSIIVNWRSRSFTLRYKKGGSD